MNKKYKYLLFDADNTLFDFNAAERRAFLALSALEPFVFTEEHYPLYHEINDLMWKRLERCEITKEELKSLRFRELFKELDREASKELICNIVEAYPRNLALGCDLIEGAADLLKNLSQSYKIYIITNGLYDVQTARLESSEIKPYITNMYVSEKVGCEKPSKSYFGYVLSDIGDMNTQNYLVIGDSLSSDIDGAINADIDCVYFDPSNVGTKGRRVTYRVSSLREIEDLI